MAQHSHDDQGLEMVSQYCSGLCAIDNGRQQAQEEGSKDQGEVEDIVDETAIILWLWNQSKHNTGKVIMV